MDEMLQHYIEQFKKSKSQGELWNNFLCCIREQRRGESPPIFGVVYTLSRLCDRLESLVIKFSDTEHLYVIENDIEIAWKPYRISLIHPKEALWLIHNSKTVFPFDDVHILNTEESNHNKVEETNGKD